MLSNELKRQRTKESAGPRIAPTLGALYGYASAVTLIIADERTDFGILTLFRDSGLGSFTSGEIRMLTLALDAFSEHLSMLRLRPLFRETSAAEQSEEIDVMARFSWGTFYILNRNFEIILTQSCDARMTEQSVYGLQAQASDRLPYMLEETIRALNTDWLHDQQQSTRVARPVPFLLVRTQPMSGRDGLFLGVHIDRFHLRHSLLGVASQYHISPREIQTLALLLDGNQLGEIASQLYITSSTVQDHINSMLEKTKSRNRSELIARIFGWYSPLNAHEKGITGARTDRDF